MYKTSIDFMVSSLSHFHIVRKTNRSQITSTFLKLLCFDIWRALQFAATMLTTAHLSHGFTPTNTRPTKKSNNKCLRYVAFERNANFQNNWEAFAHRDQEEEEEEELRICWP